MQIFIGTISKEGKTNLAIFSSVIHVGANPPALGFLMRPISVERHTYTNIKETVTLLLITLIKKYLNKLIKHLQDMIKIFLSLMLADSLLNIRNIIKAPYVKESKIKIGLKFVEEQEIKLTERFL